MRTLEKIRVGIIDIIIRYLQHFQYGAARILMNSIKVHVLQCGLVIVDKCIPFDVGSWNLLAFAGIFRPKSDQVTLPVRAYLIEHPNGLVLIDTGWHTNVREHPLRYLGPMLYMVNKPVLPPGQSIVEQLSKLGYSPSDIDILVLSHLDCDHVSGLRL